MAKPRVFISTDVGGYDKDDDQSLVHLLLYDDKLNIRGFASSPPGPGTTTDIHEVIDAYAKDYARLLSYSSAYQSPAYLHSVVHAGASQPAPSAGYSSATDASRAIIEAARASSPTDPLYVLTWGGETDIAQALHDAPDIAPNIRLLTIGRQDAAAAGYLEAHWKGKIWWIQDLTTFRGIYLPASGDNVPLSNSWAYTHARGHGALGDYFYQHTFDLYEEREGSSVVNGIKMGDTPSVLYLIDAASNNDPTAEGWGGEFVRTATSYWTDDRSASLMMGSYYGALTVAEDRSAIFAGFATRLDRAQADSSSGVTLTGTSGADTLVGGPGNDSLSGLDGNDVLNGRAGADRMVGGSGDDTYYVDNSGDVVVELAYGGSDTVFSTISYTLGAAVNNLSLSGTAATGTGNGLPNVVNGDDASNVLKGLAGSDRLSGGAGNDLLAGGIGRDTLQGGTGYDRFDWNSLSEAGKGSARDIILDLTQGYDKLDLSGIDARSATSSNDAFSFIGSASFHGVAGELRAVVIDAATDYTLIQGDVNGDRVADFELQVNKPLTLHGSDFVL